MSGLTHGTNGLLFGYTLVMVPMLVALIQARCPLSKLLLAPLWGVPVTVVAGVVSSLLSIPLHGIGVASDGVVQLLFGAAVAAGIGYVSGRLLARKPSADGSYRRGAVVSDTHPMSTPQGSQRLGDAPKGAPQHDHPITLGGIPVAAADETKHFKFIGTTGTGKSTAIREMLNAALARGDRAAIADPDGGYLSHFYNAARGDVILNPFDPDSVKWNLLGEIVNDYDVDQLARSLIPDSGASDRIWSGYARTFFTAVIQQAIVGGVKDDREILRLLTEASTEELKILLSGTMAGPFLEDGNEKMFGSMRSVMTSAVNALKYTTRQKSTPFSVRNWVRQGAARSNGGAGGALFLPYKAGEIAALRSVISAWMRIAIFEAMDRPEGDQHLWFVVDELDALGEIDGLKDALARLRKFGGRCVLGLQSISQVSSTYGKGVADTIVENCGNTLILRCSASEQGGTSQFASRLIGQREVVHLTQSRTRRPSDFLASTTTSEHRTIEPAVMASEIERLPDLEGFLKFASIPDWMRVTLVHTSYPSIVRNRRQDSAPTRPEPESAPPVVASKPTAYPAAPSSDVKSPRPTRKRARRSKAEGAGSNGASRAADRVRNAGDGGDMEFGKAGGETGVPVSQSRQQSDIGREGPDA